MSVTIGHQLCASDARLIPALMAAFFAGAPTLILGQIDFATIRSIPIRLAFGALYALPAGIAGLHAVKWLSEIGGASESWTLVFAGIGALVVGVTA